MFKWATIGIVIVWLVSMPVAAMATPAQVMQQHSVTMHSPAVGSCSFGAPQTSQWLASNSAGSSGYPGFNDAVGSNPSVGNASHSPTYSASGIFTQPYLTFNGSSSEFTVLTTPISNTITTYSFLLVINVPSTTGSNFIFGATNTDGYEYALESGVQTVIYNGATALASGTTTYSVSTNYALLTTYNSSTGVYAFYYLSGGTAYSDGSGTGTPETFTHAIAAIGDSYSGHYGKFSSPEMDFYNGTWTGGNASTIATYVHCQYGI